MAIELRKGWQMTPEESARIYGHPVEVLNKYRVLGTPMAEPSAYDTHVKSGRIQGGRSFGGDAYFSHGQIHGQYYGDYLESPNRNFVYEMNPKFDIKNNPLYFPEELRGTSKTGGSGPRLNWDTPAAAEYGSITPRDLTSYLDRVNQRKAHTGIRGGEFVSGVFANPKKGFSTGTPSIDWKFDYTKPFMETSVPTHLKNAQHVARVAMAQPETKAVLKGAGKTVGAAGLLAYIYSLGQDAPKTILEWGIPFTPMKMGMGPVLDLGRGSDLDSRRGHWEYREGKEPVFIQGQ
jgi:hypothetical protein